MIEKLKNKWGIQSNFQIVIIFVVFAINGTLATKLAGPVLAWLHVDQDSLPKSIYWLLRILIIFPIYQITLVFIGALFGQFQFFWNIEKKMLKRIGFKRLFKD